MSNFDPSLLEQTFIPWQTVSKTPEFSSAKNNDKVTAWKNWSEYAKEYWSSQYEAAPDEAKAKYQDTLAQLDGFLKSESETVSKNFTLAGKLSQIDDTNTILEYLKTPDSANKDGFAPEEYASARKRTEDYLLPQLRSFYESRGESAPADDLLRQKLWEEPNFSDHMRDIQSHLAKGFATVFLGTVQGMGALGDLMTDYGSKEDQDLIAPEDRDSGGKRLAEWAREKSKMFQENLPSDPRMNKWTEAAYSGIGQAPAQALTAWNTPLNFTANFTQVYAEETENIFEQEKKSLFDTQRAAGTIPKETPFKAWEKTLSKEQIDDLRSSAGLKAMPSTVANAAIETLAEKFAMKGIPWSSVPGGKIVQDKINKLMKTRPATAVGARIFTEGVAVAAEEGGTEGVQLVISNAAGAIAGRGELPTSSELFNQLGENVVGGAAGGIGMSGMRSPVSAYRQQAIFDQSNKILDGTAPSVQGLKSEYDKAVNEYGESSPQAEAIQKAIADVEDSAHYALYQLNSPDADKTRAERYKAANEARNTFRDQLLRWVGENQNGVEKLDEIEADRSRKTEQIRKKWKRLRQGYKDQGLDIPEEAIQTGEANEISSINEDADKRSKAANDAVMEFIGTADKAGPGRVLYARAVLAKMFPDFVFSPDFKSDSVVTEVLDAVDNGLINNKTDLEEWLSSPTPSKAAEPNTKATTTTSTSTNEDQTKVEASIQTPQVPNSSEESDGAGGRVPGSEARTSAILVEDSETKKVYTQTRDDYVYEADQISKLISDPSKKVTKKDATALLNGIVNAEQEINNANELTDEQKKEWFSPFASLRSQLEAIVNNKTAEEVQAEESTPVEQPAAEPGVSKLDQTVTSETPVKLEGQRGTLIRDDSGRPVFKPFDGSPEVELKITEGAQNKDTKDLEPSDYGTDTGTVEIADNPNKQYSVLPDNSPRPQRPFFRSNQVTKTAKIVDPELTNSVGKMMGLKREGGLTLEEGYAYRSVSPAEVESIANEGYMVTDPSLAGQTKKARGQINQKMFSELNPSMPNAAYGKDNVVVRVKKENVPQNQKGVAVKESDVEILTFNGETWVSQTPAEFVESRKPVDTAKIVADVQANPQANTKKEGSKKLISREAAVAVMVQLPETITRREAISIGKNSGMSNPTDKVLRLAQLRNDPNAARDILAGKYDSELSLFDRGAEAPIQVTGNEKAGSSPAGQAKPSASGATETRAASQTEEPEVRSNKKAPPPAVSPEQTTADRWVSDSISALQEAASGSQQGAAFLQKISTPEGKAEAQRMLAGMYFDSLLKNIKAKGISDPIVIEDAMDRILRGTVTQGGQGNLSKSVLSDLINNLKETGDPFSVKTKKGETAAYSAWLARGRNLVQPLYRQQNSREQAIPGKEGQEGGTNVENTTAAASPSSTEDVLSEGQQEVRRMTTMAVQSSYFRVVDRVAKELGLTQKEVGLVVLHLLEKNAGFEVDPVSLGWKAEGETTRIKQTVKKAVEPMFPDILRSLQAEMREAISRVQTTAEENGLLVAPVTRPTLESIIESSLYAERLQRKFQEPLKQAKENKSPEPLIPLLNQIYSDPFIRSLVNQAVATYVNNGNLLQNVDSHHRLIGALTAEDTQRILDSGLLPDSVRDVLQTLSDLSGSNGLDLVKTSSNEGYRRLADLLEEQIGKLSDPVQVVFNLALDPQVTGGGLWVGGSKVHVSPFLTAPGQMEATILHEVMHPVWDWKITTFLQDPESPLLSDNEKAALSEIKELHDRIREEAQRRVDEAKAAGKDTAVLERNLRGALGDGDPVLALREFLNETLSHKEFQDFLNEMKADGNNGSVFRRVLNLILRAITGKDVALDSVLQRTFELSLGVAKSPAQQTPQNVSQESYLQGIEQQLGRPLSPEERDVYSSDYAAKFPQSPLSDTQSEADDKASVLLSASELDSYNYLKMTEGQSVLLPRADALDTQKLAEAIKSQKGLTLNVWNGEAQSAGFVVAPYKETETKIPVNNFTASSVKAFLRKFQPLLEVPGMHFGAWIPENEPDTVYLDVSIVTNDELYATTIAQDGNQKAIFNLGAFQELTTPDLLTKYGAAVERHRASDGYQNFAASLKQAGDGVFRGVREQSDRVTSQEGTVEGRADGELAVADNPELGVVESLTGKKLTPDEIAQTQGPLQSAPTGQVDDGSGRLNFIYTSGGTNRSVPLRGAEGLRLLAEATTSNAGTNERARQTNESLSRGFRALEAAVEKAGLYIAPPFFKRLVNPRTEIAESGAEHSVYGDPSSQRVIKLTHADMVGDGSLGAKGGSSDYFTSLHLNNLVFRNTGTRFEGLVDLGEALPQVVTSQPWVQGRKATIKEIQADLKKRGFTKRDARKDANIWEHKGFGVGIYDAVPSNVLRDPEGNLHYIDVDVFPIIPLSEVYARIEGGQNVLQSAPSVNGVVPAEVQSYADKLMAMPESESDEVSPYEDHPVMGERNPQGYMLYEGMKLISKLKPNQPKFKKVSFDNTMMLGTYFDAVANIDGAPYGISLHEDPDNEEEKVYAFERIGDPKGVRTETTWGKGHEDEVVKEMQADLRNVRAMQSAPTKEKPKYKVESNMMSGDSARYFASTGMDRVSPVFKSKAEAQNWIDKQNANPAQEGFNNSQEVTDYIEKKFGKTLTALKTEAMANYAGAEAQYVVSSNRGNHFIEYNPMFMAKYTPTQVDAVMREEIIHAAAGLVLTRKGMDWTTFYGDLGNSLSKEQVSSLKKVYTSTRSKVDVGAEYFRASVQKLLYGTITEQEMKQTAMQKIIALFKDLLSYFQSKTIEPEVREVYEDTIRIMQKADPKYAAKVLQSAPVGAFQPAAALSKEQRNDAVEFFRKGSVPTATVIDLLAKMNAGDSMSITEKLPTGRLLELARKTTGAPASGRLEAMSSVRKAINQARENLASSTNTTPGFDGIRRTPVNSQAAEGVMQSAPVVNDVPEGLERLEGDSRLELTDKMWDSLTAAYAKIGGNTFKDKADLIDKGVYWDVARDSEGNPIAFFVSKPSEYGVKLAALASDGSLAGKAITSGSIISFMQTPGHWGELSEGPERVAQKAGLPMIPVEAVQQLLGPDKPITPLEDGFHYTREITTTDGLNKTVTKAVYGIPLWKTQQNNQTQTSLTGETTPSTDSASSQTTLSEIPLPKSLQVLNQSSPQQEQLKLSSLQQPEQQESQSPKPLFSAPVFQGAPVPGFTPSVFTPASRRQTEALFRVRMNPEYSAIQNALGNKTYYSWTEKDTLAKADEFIAAFNGDLQLAFQSSITNPGLTNEQAIMVRGLSIKRAQAAANAAGEGMTDTSLSAQRRNDMAMARDYYQSLAETFADSVMNEASQAGQELRTFRMLADVLVPQTWVKRYKDPVIRSQRKKLGKNETAQQLLQGLMDSRRMAANSTFDRMQKALAMAGRKFLPEGTSAEEVEAYEDVARMLASGLPVREDVKKAASERVVVSGLETIKKELGLRAEKADPALLRQWEDRLREIAGEQIDRIIESRLKGGEVDKETTTMTDEQKQAAQEQKIMDVWRSLSDVPLAETVFNLARAAMETAKNPYSGLLRNAVFDTNRVSQIEKAVRLSINTAEEIRKSVTDKGMSVEALKLRLEETNPNLSSEELDKLSNAVEAVYNDEVSKASRAALDRLVKAAANPAQARKLTDSNTVMKLLPLVNMGAFSEEAVYNAIADKFNLPTWSAESAKAIEEAATRVQALPEGSIQRGEAGQEMMIEILRANMKDSKGGKRIQHINHIASAVWTAGILSGFPTQIINATATSASVFMESLAEATGRFIEAKKRGVSTAQATEFYKDIAKMWLFSFGKDANNTSIRALNEVYTAMTKGTTKFKAEKMEDLAPLELFKFDPRVAIPGNAMMDALVNGELREAGKQGLKAGLGLAISGIDKAIIQRSPKEALKDYLAVLKMVGRTMLAADAVNSASAAYIKEAMIKRTMLQMEGLSDSEVNRFMDEVVKGGEKSLVEEAKAQVEDEATRGDFGATGTTAHDVAKARRLEQLIETATYGKSVVEAGRDFAADASFNANPYGVVGMLSMEIFGRLNSALGLAAKPVNPFPKTLSNLFNNALNYTLWGSVRAQGWNPTQFLLDENSKYFKASPDQGSAEYYAAHARAVAGTSALMVFAAMLAQAFKDRKEGKEPFFEVHGSGPTDPKQRKTWSNAGNKAFSIRIGNLNLRFTDWPGINLALGALGTVYDQAVYGDGEADVADKLFTAVAAVAGTTLNRNMLGGASALFDIMSQNTYEGAKQRAAASFASSYVTGFTKPSMVRWLETNMTGSYADTRGMSGWLLSMVPFGGTVAGKPALNVLGEEIQVTRWDATMGRLVSPRQNHVVLSPLVNAGLSVPLPQHYKLLDRSKESGMRKMTADEFYEYGKLYGERLKERLTPQKVESLVERAKRDPQAAQDRLNEIATIARNKAQNELRREKELKRAPRTVPKGMRAQPTP